MTDQQPQITVIGPDTRIKGEMSFESTARILGRFEGSITSGGELQIGSTAECAATLEAETIIVEGRVDGNIAARERLQLNSSARIEGDIVAEKLIVAEGASFSGRCRVGPEAVADHRARGKGSGTQEAERPIPEVKPAGTNAAAFDWVDKNRAEPAEAKSGSGGWGPRAVPADGAA